MTDALRIALAEALPYAMRDPDTTPAIWSEVAAEVLAHPAVLAALDRSDPDTFTPSQRALIDGQPHPALTATPTTSTTEAERVARNISRHIPASPTEPTSGEGSGSDRPLRPRSGKPLAASPTAGLREAYERWRGASAESSYRADADFMAFMDDFLAAISTQDERHPYTCGTCSWGRDGSYHDEREYKIHIAATGHDGRRPTEI